MKVRICSLSKNEDFRSILNGKKINNKYSTIFFKEIDRLNSKQLNISFIAKKKLGNAVIRNKIKETRETYRSSRSSWLRSLRNICEHALHIH